MTRRREDKLPTSGKPHTNWPYLVRFEKADGYKEWVRENVKGEHAIYKLQMYKSLTGSEAVKMHAYDRRAFLERDPYPKWPDDLDYENPDPMVVAACRANDAAHKRRLYQEVPPVRETYHLAFADKQDAMMFKLAWGNA